MYICPRTTIESNLPHEVVQDQENPILRQLTEEFIDVSLLTNGTITVWLIDGDLKLWEIKLETRDGKSSVCLNLEHLGCEIEIVQSSSDELVLRLVEKETC